MEVCHIHLSEMGESKQIWIAQCIPISHRRCRLTLSIVADALWAVCGRVYAFSVLNAFGRVIANNLIFEKSRIWHILIVFSFCVHRGLFHWMDPTLQLQCISSIWMEIRLCVVCVCAHRAMECQCELLAGGNVHMTRHEFLFTRFFFSSDFQSLRRWSSIIERKSETAVVQQM